MALMSLTEYARYKNWHHSTVQEKIQSGIITARSLHYLDKTRYKIDSEIADMEIEMNGDTFKSAVYKSTAEKKKTILRPAPKSETAPPDAEEAEPEEPTQMTAVTESLLKFRDVKTDTEKIRLRRMELDLAEQEGRLLDVEEVRKRVQKLVSETRNTILNVPSRIGPQLFGCKTLFDMEAKLMEELNLALETLSRFE